MGMMCDCRMCGGQHEHWGEDSAAPVSTWQEQVANGDTRLGYWDWAREYKEISSD